MDISIKTTLSYGFDRPTDLLMQVEAAHMVGQDILSESLSTTPVRDFRRVTGGAGVGTRAWMATDAQLDVTYAAKVRVTREDPDWASQPATPPRQLDAEGTAYILPSRYCPVDEFEAFVDTRFGPLSGGAAVAAMADWIYENFSYLGGVSNASTTARETFVQRRGVCRDYAHVMIAMARAAGIPARMASVYAPRVDPADFHAVTQVQLGGQWHLIDATRMARASEMAVIGIGRDAAEVSFLTTFGLAQFIDQKVAVTADPEG